MLNLQKPLPSESRRHPVHKGKRMDHHTPPRRRLHTQTAGTRLPSERRPADTHARPSGLHRAACHGMLLPRLPREMARHTTRTRAYRRRATLRRKRDNGMDKETDRATRHAKQHSGQPRKPSTIRQSNNKSHKKPRTEFTMRGFYQSCLHYAADSEAAWRHAFPVPR